MTTSERNALIDSYFEALDSGDHSLLRDAFAPDVVYTHPSGEMIGLDAVLEFFETERHISATTHDLVNRVHGDDHSVCEGVVTGHIQGHGDFDGPFCDVFAFRDGTVSELRLYDNIQLDLS